MQRVTRLGAAALTVALFLCGCVEGGASGQQKAVERVNGTVIRKVQVDRAVQAMLSRNPGVKLAPEQMQETTETALRQLTDSELMYQEGCKLAMKDLDQLVDREFAAYRAKFASDDAFQKAVQSLQMSEREVRQAMRREIVVNNYIQKRFVSATSITDEQGRKFYGENRERLFRTVTYPQARVRIIEYLKREKVRTAVESYLAGLRFRARIERL